METNSACEIGHDPSTHHDLTVNINEGEFPFAPGGYCAVYLRGPDRLKLEIVHMPLAEQRARSLGHIS